MRERLESGRLGGAFLDVFEPDDTLPPPGLYQFALAPEDEAIAAMATQQMLEDITGAVTEVVDSAEAAVQAWRGESSPKCRCGEMAPGPSRSGRSRR